ncbi:outer membrane beta-barrel domain-containing protein [Pajaroellobacter abortibovis]|uniref:Outer membrane beta-barrel domain-containing protein n=1 Tax=Pajaroellobacter abortibovis TaxID=1882918 RepID=A0A1L6MZL6_9BACT|nr:outer membrane beta-barrel domain-containing protein [Pajaroellobacter abortibovis]
MQSEVYTVQQIYALRTYRLEIQPYWSFSLNDQFISHPGLGLALNFYVTHTLAFGLSGNLYQRADIDYDFNFQNRRATRTAVPLTEYQWNANANVIFVPIYGKFAGLRKFIFNYDIYMVAGAGSISTRPLPIMDPDNRNFPFKPKFAGNAGVGLRIFINRWFAATLEVRDYIYNEQLEALTVANTQTQQQNPNTWYGNTNLTNNIQAQLGISIFLPFNWDYRLPK